MKRSILRKLLAAFTCMVAILGLSVTSLAAGNVCKQISGNSGSTKSFYINTGSRWYSTKDVLKLSQTKGTMKIMKLINGKHTTKSMYEKYYVKVEKLKNNKVINVKNYTWQKASLKLKLDKKSTYRVTITPTAVRNRSSFGDGTLFNPYGSIFFSPLGWKKHSTWKVSSTSGIISCK